MIKLNANIPTDIQLVVLDIDGTLAGKSNQIREPVKQAVQAVQAQGIPVAIATGRMYCSALRFYHDLNLTLPLIAYQGAWIQAPQDPEPLQRLFLPLDLASELLDHFTHSPLSDQLSIHLYQDDVLYVRDNGAETKAYAQRSQVKTQPVEDLRQVLTAQTTKLLTLSSQAATIDTIWQDLSSRYTPDQLYLTRSTDFFVEAVHPQANKGQAVQTLTEKILHLKPEQVLAIGDHFNDLEMLTYAGFGIAMGDAPEPVKAIAQWVAPNVEADGVAVALEKFLLSRTGSQP
jgi:Cof subfamily protein (haloacid dehalogenase superfamily)